MLFAPYTIDHHGGNGQGLQPLNVQGRHRRTGRKPLCPREPVGIGSQDMRSAARLCRRTRNTTKCDIEKLTTKPARIAMPFAGSTGTNFAAMTRTVVLTSAP